MAAATVTITLTCSRDLVSVAHAGHPENFPGLAQVVIDFIRKELGPDAGIAGTVTLKSITIV